MIDVSVGSLDYAAVDHLSQNLCEIVIQPLSQVSFPTFSSPEYQHTHSFPTLSLAERQIVVRARQANPQSLPR